MPKPTKKEKKVKVVEDVKEEVKEDVKEEVKKEEMKKEAKEVKEKKKRQPSLYNLAVRELMKRYPNDNFSIIKERREELDKIKEELKQKK